MLGSPASSAKVLTTEPLYVRVSNCPEGQRFDPGRGCTKCPAGTHRPTSNSENECIPCPAGSSTDGHEGAASCMFCMDGLWSKQGSSTCSKCDFGRFSGLGWSGCQNCPDGVDCEAGRLKLLPDKWILPGTADPTMILPIQHPSAATLSELLRRWRETPLAALPCFPHFLLPPARAAPLPWCIDEAMASPKSMATSAMPCRQHGKNFRCGL